MSPESQDVRSLLFGGGIALALAIGSVVLNLQHQDSRSGFWMLMWSDGNAVVARMQTALIRPVRLTGSGQATAHPR